jgi:hypothetical protein
MTMRGLAAKEAVGVHLLDELLEHLFGDGEVGDHAVFHRADGLDGARVRPSMRLLQADGQDGFLVGGYIAVNGDHGWFVKHDALATHVNEGVGRAKVDGKVVGEVSGERTKHWAVLVQFPSVGRDARPANS